MDKSLNTMVALFHKTMESYSDYIGDGKIYPALFLLSLMFLYVQGKREENRHFFVSYSVCMIAMIFFPGFAYIYDKMPGIDVYWRMFWLLPVSAVIAYTGAKYSERITSKGKKAITVAVMMAAIALGGNCIYNSENFSKPENAYKIPQAAIEICKVLTDREENPTVVVPYGLTPYIRQADSGVHMLYGRDTIVGWKSESSKLAKQISDEISKGDPDTDTLVELVRKAGCKYLVLNNGQALSAPPTDYGFTIFKEFGDYVIYLDSQVE